MINQLNYHASVLCKAGRGGTAGLTDSRLDLEMMGDPLLSPFRLQVVVLSLGSPLSGKGALRRGMFGDGAIPRSIRCLTTPFNLCLIRRFHSISDLK